MENLEKVATLEERKIELQKIQEKMNVKKLALKEQIQELKEEAKKLAEKEKAEAKLLKAKEEKNKALDLAKRMQVVMNDPKVNMTENIRRMMLESKTIDEMVEESGYVRKAILDRRWLIIEDLKKKEAKMNS